MTEKSILPKHTDTDTELEAVARAICIADDCDPDDLEPGNTPYGDEREFFDGTIGVEPAYFLWRNYVGAAGAAITALEAARSPTSPTDGDDWRCVNCKRVARAICEPNRCVDCQCREFAHIVPSTIPTSPREGEAAYHIERARTWIAEPASITSEKRMTSARWHLDKALAALSKPVTEANGWRDIETAPKDGSNFLAFGDLESYIFEARLYRDGRCHNLSSNRWAKPSHWQPLPEPPSLSERGERDGN